MNERNREICEEYISEMLKEYLEQELGEDEFDFILESYRDELIKEYTLKIIDDWWIHYGKTFTNMARQISRNCMEYTERME